MKKGGDPVVGDSTHSGSNSRRTGHASGGPTGFIEPLDRRAAVAAEGTALFANA